VTRRDWDFEYRVPARAGAPKTTDDFVVATQSEVRTEEFARAFATCNGDARIDSLLVRPPLFWYRVRTASPNSVASVGEMLAESEVPTRYVTSAAHCSLALAPRPDFSRAPRCPERRWKRGVGRTHADDPPSHWFLSRDSGVDVDRDICGTGLGTRLAVIDDEARDADSLDLDAEVLVGVPAVPRGATHGAVMTAWAVGTRGNAEKDLPPYTGVAPDAACRLYVIPRPGQQVLWLPLAIVRAVDDGADVVVCATYVENTTSPLLDDALEFAVRMGRGGLGTAVVLPTGREISSPASSIHASLTLDFGDPTSDPRVLTVAPSAQSGGWFFWTDKKGNRRPFANRGPAVRISAPGDDMPYPFANDGRFGHAESSGASAIAAGVALLVLGQNPELRVDELYGLLTSTARDCPTEPGGPPGDPEDLLPSGRDSDGHDAKVGHGRASTLRACLAASDPIAATLLTIGEEEAARRFLAIRRSARSAATAYSERLARWAARTLRNDPILAGGCAALCRHLRLLAGNVDRQNAQSSGATARALAVLIARLAAHSGPDDVAGEIRVLDRRACDATNTPAARRDLESALFSLASELWVSDRGVGAVARRA
jgi:hypothetical protein